MMQVERHSKDLCPECRIADVLRRIAAPLATLLAIGLASSVAFIVLVWVDASLKVLSPAVFRLGISNQSERPQNSDALSASSHAGPSLSSKMAEGYQANDHESPAWPAPLVVRQ